MPFYPRLPDPTAVKPENYVADFIGGMQAGQQLGTQAMRNEAQALALQQYKDRQAAMKGYAETGDIAPVMQADPEFGLKLQGELRRMGAEERKEAVEGLSKAADFVGKALPFLNAQTYPAFAQAASRIPLLSGLVPPKFDPNWVADATRKMISVKQELQRPISAGGSIWNPQTQSWMTPPERPMTEFQQRQLELRERGLDIQQEKAERPPREKIVPDSKLRRDAGQEIDRSFKWKENKDTYESQARQKILSGMTFPLETYKGLGPTKQVPFEELPDVRQTVEAKKLDAKVLAEAKRMFEEDRQKKIDMTFQEMRREQGPSPAGRGATKQYTPDQLRTAYDQKATEIAAMPDGPGKDAASRSLEDWKNKYLR